MFVSPCNEGIILVFAQKGQIWSRPQVHRQHRKKKSNTNQSEEAHPKYDEKNNSTQYSHFLLLEHTPINIYLILDTHTHSFLSSCIGFLTFWLSTHTRTPVFFFSLAQKFHQKQLQPKTNPQAG